MQPLIWWIVVGLVAGVLASLVVGGVGYGIIGDIVIGIVGAFIGGWLFSALGVTSADGRTRGNDSRRLHWRDRSDLPHSSDSRRHSARSITRRSITWRS